MRRMPTDREPSPSPITLEELERLKRTVSFTARDVRNLRRVGEALAGQLDDVLDAWFRTDPHLHVYFATPEGQTDVRYLEAVRRRSGQWILETCRRDYDRAWLDTAHEIGLRHHRTKKNQTDGVVSVPHVPLRYLIAFGYHTTRMIRPFLLRRGYRGADVLPLYDAWHKAVTLQVALWSYVYAKEGDW
jgi:Protoglobin